jgi:hypothetical protein
MYRNSRELGTIIIGLVCVVVITYVVTKLFKARIIKNKNLPFTIIFIIMFIGEIIKQIINFFFSDGSLWSLPFHISSSFMIYYGLATFKSKRLKNIGYGAALYMGIGFSIIFFLYPGKILGLATDNLIASFFEMHTFIYHFLMVLYTFILVLNFPIKPDKKYAPHISLTIISFLIVSFIAANILDVNYSGFLANPFLEISIFNIIPPVYSYLFFNIVIMGIFSGLFYSQIYCRFILKDTYLINEIVEV